MDTDVKEAFYDLLILMIALGLVIFAYWLSSL
ncbi:hypothetical protein YN1_5010 [Nanoarchaeota archaeon]